MRALMDSVMGNNNGGTALSYLDMLSGGAFSNATLFAMGVSPYINSSIIMQLLTVAIQASEWPRKRATKDCYHHRVCYIYLGLIQGTASISTCATRRGSTERSPCKKSFSLHHYSHLQQATGS